MTCVAVVSKPRKPELAHLLPELVEWLRKNKFEPLLDHEGACYTQSAPAVDRAELPAHKPKLVIVLGGDGTLLSVARIFAATGTPILSVNLGSLGFLTEVRLADLYTTLASWCDDCHALDARKMLHAEVLRDGAVVRTFEALNEVVVSKGDIARMGEFAVELDGKSVARFRADGVIVSTPTGSTAYTLAANGPILTPNVDALVVTPICPHLLTLRPIVVRGDALLAVRVEGVPTQCLLTVDGQTGFELHVGDEVRCRRSDYTVNLVRISESGFFEVLRSKLSWGER
ncbi:MAG TPA: NAD(+)/NADH kinase [Terracidiphilus sp.]|jgi:NAD+ kinase